MVPVYKYLLEHGFDPEQDMLMANVTHPKIAGKGMPGWMFFGEGVSDSSKRETAFFNYGGLKVDWKHQTNIPGLFAVGNNVGGSEGASTAASNGRYLGRNLAQYVKGKTLCDAVESQVQAEKERIYAPLKNTEGPGWREIQIGLCRVMQDYLGEYKEEHVLKMGLWWMDSIRKNEIARAKVNNPRELAKLWDTETRLTSGEMIMHNSLARNRNCAGLDFKVLGGREDIPMDKDCMMAIRLENGQVVSEEVPFHFWDANGKATQENYEENCCMDDIDRGGAK
jgi:succinate dehydrogenase/fumarate reductase flavoprotein subunit